MKEMTEKEALAEAVRRWGPTGAIRYRPAPNSREMGGKGRLARYPCTVGNGNLGKSCSVEGQGDDWRSAFEDARTL